VNLYYLDKFGWPVVTIKGKPITNVIRRLIHIRKITTKRPACLDPGLPDPNCLTPNRREK